MIVIRGQIIYRGFLLVRTHHKCLTFSYLTLVPVQTCATSSSTELCRNFLYKAVPQGPRKETTSPQFLQMVVPVTNQQGDQRQYATCRLSFSNIQFCFPYTLLQDDPSAHYSASLSSSCIFPSAFFGNSLTTPLRAIPNTVSMIQKSWPHAM